uniref:Uncharacterized protein n=1 Tax=Pectinophora gossypiella TaxID=13191 RepID=A0A1E1WHN1_PECGO
MVNLQREGLSLLLKLGRAIAESEDTTEVPEEVNTLKPAETNVEPMKAYWESDKEELEKKKAPFIDLFIKNIALERIPDSTPKPIAESHYDFEKLSLVYLPEFTTKVNEKLKEPSSTPFVPPLAPGTVY